MQITQWGSDYEAALGVHLCGLSMLSNLHFLCLHCNILLKNSLLCTFLLNDYNRLPSGCSTNRLQLVRNGFFSLVKNWCIFKFCQHCQVFSGLKLEIFGFQWLKNVPFCNKTLFLFKSKWAIFKSFFFHFVKNNFHHKIMRVNFQLALYKMLHLCIEVYTLDCIIWETASNHRWYCTAYTCRLNFVISWLLSA